MLDGRDTQRSTERIAQDQPNPQDLGSWLCAARVVKGRSDLAPTVIDSFT